MMLRVQSGWLATAFLATLGGVAVGAYPISSRFARQPEGPYAPQTNRYVVVDPTPVSPPAAKNGKPTPGAEAILWQRRDAATPVYPYGWFGAQPATQRWTHTYFYGDYNDARILRGR